MRKRFSNGITQVELSSRENKEDIRSGGQNRRSQRFTLEKPQCRAANISSNHWQNSGALEFVNEEQGQMGGGKGIKFALRSKATDAAVLRAIGPALLTKNSVSLEKPSLTKRSLVRAMYLGELKLSVIHLGRRIFRYSLADRGLYMIAFQMGHVLPSPDQRFIPRRQILRRQFNGQIAVLADYRGVYAP
jgi:hypothetical protein